MNPITAINKQMVRHYCDCLNKVFWKLPLAERFANEKNDGTAFAKFLAAEASEGISMRQITGTKYDIEWNQKNEQFQPKRV